MAVTPTTYNPSYRYGDSKPVRQNWFLGSPINTGDFLFVSLGARTDANGSLTSGSPTVTSTTALFGPGDVGASITSTDIPAGTTIISVTSSTTATMSANATATATGQSLVITPVAPNAQGVAGEASVFAAQYFPWTTNLATTQANFVAQFVGVAGQTYQPGYEMAYGIQDGTLDVWSSGVFDFNCASATFNQGDIVGLAQDVGSNLTGQTVVAVSALNEAVARVVQPYPYATTVVRCAIFAPFANLVNAGALPKS